MEIRIRSFMECDRVKILLKIGFAWQCKSSFFSNANEHFVKIYFNVYDEARKFFVTFQQEGRPLVRNLKFFPIKNRIHVSVSSAKYK